MSYALLSESFPVANKRHRCIWCGESILPGEKYRNERSVFDGEMQHHKWHLECSDAAAHDEDMHLWGGEFQAHENERPPSPATLEYESWTSAIGGVALPADQQEKELGACSLSRATIGDKTHDRETENSNRRAGGQEQGGGEAGRCDAVRTSGVESGARGGNAGQHEEVKAEPGSEVDPWVRHSSGALECPMTGFPCPNNCERPCGVKGLDISASAEQKEQK